MRGLSNLRQAVAELDGPGDHRARLRRAAVHLYAATLVSDVWPAAQQAHAALLHGRLTVRGVIGGGVDMIAEDDLGRVAAGLRRLHDEFAWSADGLAGGT